MKLTDLSNKVKAITGAVVGLVAVAGIIFAWVGFLQTDAEAQEHVDDFVDYQQQQYEADKYDRVDRVQREIDRIDFQLLTDDLPEKKAEYLKAKRTDNVKKVECIQEETC